MPKLTKRGTPLKNDAVLTLTLSAIAFVWGRSYMGEHQLVGFASAFGYQDPVYSLAQGAVVLGSLGFLVGIVLLIVAIDGTPASSAATEPRDTKGEPGRSIRGALSMCRECGRMVSIEAATCPGCGVPGPVPRTRDAVTFVPGASAVRVAPNRTPSNSAPMRTQPDPNLVASPVWRRLVLPLAVAAAVKLRRLRSGR